MTEMTEYRGKVRGRDRDTSWEAASRQTNTKTAALQIRIYEALLDKPMTDEELLIRLGGIDTKVTGSGIRTRRHELELAGWVTPLLSEWTDMQQVAPVTDPVVKRLTLSGSWSTVWRAVREDEPAPEVAPSVTTKAREANAAGLAAARRFAGWEIGDAAWADKIIEAYLNPKAAQSRLDAEMSE